MLSICNLGDPLSNILNYLPNFDILNMRCVNIYLNDFVCNNLNIEKREINVKWKNIKNLKFINNTKSIKWMLFDIDDNDYNCDYDKYDVSSNNLNNNIKDLKQISSLIIKNNKNITTKSIFTNELTSLRYLTIQDNIDSNIDDNLISNLINLEGLVLKNFSNASGVLISYLGLKSLTKLQLLDISYNSSICDNDIKHLTNITHLNVAGTNITDDSITNFGLLETLYLDNNVHVTDKSLKYLTNLKNLYLWENDVITDVGICHLTSLTDLDISNNNNITKISHLTKLNILSLAENYVISDDELSKMTMIKWLSLVGNYLITDNSLTKLTKLCTLDMRYHGYTRISVDSIKKLPNLTKLILYEYDHITKDDVSCLTNLIDLNTSM